MIDLIEEHYNKYVTPSIEGLVYIIKKFTTSLPKLKTFKPMEE